MDDLAYRCTNETKKIHLTEMIKTQGWKLVVDHIDSEIANAINRLVIAEVDAVPEYQRTIKILRQLKKYVYDGAGVSPRNKEEV